MKRILALVLALGLALSARARRAPSLEIFNDRGFETARYSRLTLYSVGSKDYLKSVAGTRNYDEIAYQCHEMDMLLKSYLAEFCESEFRGGKRGRELKMTVRMSDYNAGSTAARVWVGYGAGNGHCRYEFHFWDGKKDVASFEATARISRGWDASGEAGRAKAPQLILGSLKEFLDTH